MTFEEIIELLPYELRVEGNASGIKKVLEIYSKASTKTDSLNEIYGRTMDIYGSHGIYLDYIGAMFAVAREDNESDENLRTRILSAVIRRKTPTTLPAMQEAVDSVVSSGKLYVLENYGDRSCNIYITGTANERDLNTAIDIVKSILPAGVYIIIPVVSFDTWRNIYDQFDTWESISNDGYIW